MSVNHVIKFVGTESDFTKIEGELDGDLLTLRQDVNGLETHQIVMDDTQFEEVIAAYYEAKKQRDAGIKE